MYPMCVRVSWVIGLPLKRTWPESAASTPSAMRMVVVFPAPLLPTKPNSSPARTSKVTESSATVTPYRLETRSISSVMSVNVGPLVDEVFWVVVGQDPAGDLVADIGRAVSQLSYRSSNQTEKAVA